MKKYILTETQMKNVLNAYINEIENVAPTANTTSLVNNLKKEIPNAIDSAFSYIIPPNTSTYINKIIDLNSLRTKLTTYLINIAPTTVNNILKGTGGDHYMNNIYLFAYNELNNILTNLNFLKKNAIKVFLPKTKDEYIKMVNNTLNKTLRPFVNFVDFASFLYVKSPNGMPQANVQKWTNQQNTWWNNNWKAIANKFITLLTNIFYN
jgi:hypothetical protein